MIIPLIGSSIEPKIPIIPVIYNSNGITTIVEGNIIASGGYGTVTKCSLMNGRQMAVKKIKTGEDGIPCLMEASIMATIDHPYLNKSYEIHCLPQMLYIIQELAVMDLRMYRQQALPSIDQIILWFHQIIQGLSHLHQYKIIHGDIKASNILLYADNTVKISDFNLSTKFEWPHNYMTGTSSHRAPEVWVNIGSWDESVDLWSLGCLLFELLYGHSLFPIQKSSQSINAIIDWCCHGPVQQDIYLKYRDVVHTSYILPSIFDLDLTPKGQLNQMIMSMLKFNPSSRISLHQLLISPLFESFKTIASKPHIISQLSFNISSRELIESQLNQIVQNKNIINYSLYLYSRVKDLKYLSDEIKTQTCLWIAYKLICRNSLDPSKLPQSLSKILEAERKICFHLKFQLDLLSI